MTYRCVWLRHRCGLNVSCSLYDIWNVKYTWYFNPILLNAMLMYCKLVFVGIEADELHLASSLSEFMWYIIFAKRKFIHYLVVWFLLEIRWWHLIDDAKSSSYFWHKPYCRFVSMNKPSANLQSHENSFEELAKCSEIISWCIRLRLHPLHNYHCVEGVSLSHSSQYLIALPQSGLLSTSLMNIHGNQSGETLSWCAFVNCTYVCITY